MGRVVSQLRWPFFLVVAFLLLGPDRSHLLNHYLHHDEALAIFLGRAVLAGGPCDGACAQHTGSVLLHPVAAAVGDAWAGLYGARLISVGFGLLLVAVVVATGQLLIGRVGGWLAGAVLLVQAPFLYVSRMALYDVVAATLLGVAMVCVVAAERHRMTSAAGWWLMGAAVALVGAAMAKYVTAVYLPLVLVIVLWRFRVMQSVFCFMVPVVILGGWYGWGALWPRFAEVLGQLANVTSRGQGDFGRAEVLQMLVRWLIWPTFFAVAGVLLSDRAPPQNTQTARRAGFTTGSAAEWVPSRTWWLVMVMLALPVPIAHLVSGGVQGLNKNVVQPMVFLAPIAAYGLLRLTQPFHVKRAVNAQWAVLGIVFAAMVWGAVHGRSWLEHQYSDLNPVVEELKRVVTPQTILMTDTDALYRYELAGRLPDDHVVLTYWVGYKGSGGEAGAIRFVEDQQPDYIVLDGYYGQPALHERLRMAMEGHYQLRHRWPLILSWGRRTVDLYERKGVAG